MASVYLKEMYRQLQDHYPNHPPIHTHTPTKHNKKMNQFFFYVRPTSLSRIQNGGRILLTNGCSRGKFMMLQGGGFVGVCVHELMNIFDGN